jgi:hypothetical protein
VRAKLQVGKYTITPGDYTFSQDLKVARDAGNSRFIALLLLLTVYFGKRPFQFMTIFGIILAVLGYVIRYTMNRRAFNRRNAAGVEQFKSYEAATGTRFWKERAAYLPLC